MNLKTLALLISAVLVFGSSSLMAEMVVRWLQEPIVEVSDADPGGQSSLDLDMDGTADFILSAETHVYPRGGSDFWMTDVLQVQPRSNNEVLVDVVLFGTVSALPVNFQIPVSPPYDPDDFLTKGWRTGSYDIVNQAWGVSGGRGYFQDNGGWGYDRKGYMGVKFYIEGRLHCGWVYLEISPTNATTTIHGWGYETQPDTPILAGVIPDPATNPVPGDGTTRLPQTLDLRWSPCAGATEYDVYLNGRLRSTQTSTVFRAANLRAGATQVWRIDAANPAETTRGSNWTFTTRAPTPPERVITPRTPVGPSVAKRGKLVLFTTGGARSSHGHPVEYRISWGDGTTSPWLPPGITFAGHRWKYAGTYHIRAQTRCANHPAIASSWSAPATLNTTR